MNTNHDDKGRFATGSSAGKMMKAAKIAHGGDPALSNPTPASAPAKKINKLAYKNNVPAGYYMSRAAQGALREIPQGDAWKMDTVGDIEYTANEGAVDHKWEAKQKREAAAQEKRINAMKRAASRGRRR